LALMNFPKKYINHHNFQQLFELNFWPNKYWNLVFFYLL